MFGLGWLVQMSFRGPFQPELVYGYMKGYLCGLTAGSLEYLFLLKVTKAN